MLLYALALSALLSAALPGASAEPQRFALLVGSNEGSVNEPTLLYAESDVRKIADVLVNLGGIPKDHIVPLLRPTAADLRAQFLALRAQFQEAKARGASILLIVYYSGHADSSAIHLAGTLLDWSELLQLTNQTNANTRLVVVDACRSGQLTRVKGIRRIVPFLLPERENALPQGLAILASSSVDESAQESDILHDSVFTHHFIEALRGAADRNADGAISLSEAFEYSAESTAATSVESASGLQHATYRYRLQGREDLVLTRPNAAIAVGYVNLSEPGEYLFALDKPDGPQMLDAVVGEQGRSVSLPVGHYFVRVRTPSALLEGYITVATGVIAALDNKSLKAVKLSRVTAKGGPATLNSYHTSQTHEAQDAPSAALWFGAGAAAPLIGGFTTPWDVSGMGTLAVGGALLDLQLHGGHNSATNPNLVTSMVDVGVAAGVRAHADWGPFTFSVGSRVGVDYVQETYTGPSAPASRYRFAPHLDALGRMDIFATEHWFVGVEGGVRALYLTRNVSSTNNNTTWIDVQPYGLAGVGYCW